MSQKVLDASVPDRAGRASPQAPSGLDHPATIPCAESAPFRAEKRNGYWILVDDRSGQVASYPTTQKNCLAEAEMMNRTYADLLAEERA